VWLESQKGNLEMVADVGYDTIVTVAPNYPLPQDVMQLPVKVCTVARIPLSLRVCLSAT
jgi:hypothetical protein